MLPYFTSSTSGKAGSQTGNVLCGESECPWECVQRGGVFVVIVETPFVEVALRSSVASAKMPWCCRVGVDLQEGGHRRREEEYGVWYEILSLSFGTG